MAWSPPQMISLDDADASDPALSADLRTIVFTSDVTGADRIYVATR